MKIGISKRICLAGTLSVLIGDILFNDLFTQVDTELWDSLIKQFCDDPHDITHQQGIVKLLNSFEQELKHD